VPLFELLKRYSGLEAGWRLQMAGWAGWSSPSPSQPAEQADESYHQLFTN